MCPIIEGADMTSISTERELLPEGEYLLLVTDSEISEDKKSCIIKHRVEDAPTEGAKFVGQEWQNWINIVQNDGKKNEIGFTSIKKYLEAVFGKGSVESNTADTDPLNGYQVRVYITQKSWKKDGEDRSGNNIKRFLKV